jgi:hypothetical protein
VLLSNLDQMALLECVCNIVRFGCSETWWIRKLIRGVEEMLQPLLFGRSRRSVFQRDLLALQKLGNSEGCKSAKPEKSGGVWKQF